MPLLLYWVAVALPRSGGLTLDEQGFEARHAWIGRRWDWDHVTGFALRHISYARGGSIDLVSFATRDPRERPGDGLQELGIRGLTRTTTLPDRYGQKPEALAGAMSQCRSRFSDRAEPDDGPAVERDVARSRVLNAITLVVLMIVMTVASVSLALGGHGAERIVGWVGGALFGVGGAAGIAIRWGQWRRSPHALGGPAPMESDADLEIASTAASSGLPRDVAGRVVEAHYAFLERQPRDRPLDEGTERTWVAVETGLDEDTVRRVLDAHDEFLAGSGLMRPAPQQRA